MAALHTSGGRKLWRDHECLLLIITGLLFERSLLGANSTHFFDNINPLDAGSIYIYVHNTNKRLVHEVTKSNKTVG